MPIDVSFCMKVGILKGAIIAFIMDFSRKELFCVNKKEEAIALSVSRILKWITGVFEALLGIPVLGGWYILSNLWAPLLVMLILHIITLVLTRKDHGSGIGSIIGIVTSIIGWIPIVGMIMHLITALALILSAMKPEPKQYI